MLNKRIVHSAKRKISITRNELRQLVFWAGIGTEGKIDGSYYPEVLETIKEFSRKLNL